jgi:hypothetical protein
VKGCACYPEPGDPRQGSRCAGCPARRRPPAFESDGCTASLRFEGATLSEALVKASDGFRSLAAVLSPAPIGRYTVPTPDGGRLLYAPRPWTRRMARALIGARSRGGC